MSRSFVLLVGKSPEENLELSRHFEGHYQIFEASSPKEALKLYKQHYMKIRVVLLGVAGTDSTHFELLTALKHISQLPEVIVYSDQENIQIAVEAIKNGAYTYISRPFQREALLLLVEKTIASINIARKLEDFSPAKKIDPFNLSNYISSLEAHLFQGHDTQEPAASTPTAVQQAFYEKLNTLLEKHIADKIVSGKKSSVLIVEDEEIYRRFMKGFLEKNYTVFEAENGDGALRMLRDNPSIDLVLLDIFLPDMSGVDLLPELRSMSPDLQVIVITAFEFVDIAVQTLRNGACDYINKPFLKSQFLQTVEKALQKKFLEKDLPQMVKSFVENHLPYQFKIEILDELRQNRRQNGEGMVMEDIYAMFPELRKTCIPDGLTLPETVLSDGLTTFVSDLHAQVDQLSPN